MMTNEEARHLVETTVPFLQRAGLQAPVMERGRVVTEMPLAGNTNHNRDHVRGGSFFGGRGYRRCHVSHFL